MTGARPLRWIGITVCVVLAGISLAYGIIYLGNGWGRSGGSDLAWAGLFGVSAVLLWRRFSWRRAGLAFGLWVLGCVVLYIVLFELHNHGHLGGASALNPHLQRTATHHLGWG